MSEHDDMELKQAMDALPRSIEPPADLWPGVRGRLGARAPRVRSIHSSHWRIAALLAALAISSGALAMQRHAAAQWRLYASDGLRGTMHAGDSLSTHAKWTAFDVGTIGTVEIDSGASLRVLAAGASAQRLQLNRGRIQARINAPPRLFAVETPSGTAVDLGCAYTLDVDKEGNSRLVVSLGWVSFEDAHGHSLIPAGMYAIGSRTSGIGTPVREDAAERFQLAVTTFDIAPSDSLLGEILRGARARDAVTLWHLVGHTGGPRRSQVIDRLTSLVPLPPGVPREGIEHNNYTAMRLYWIALPGTLPIIPSWQASLWRLWLRLGG